MKLWLVRHAAPLVAPGTCYGASDVAADAAGTQEAAQRLAHLLPAGVAVRCSPLRRCQALADQLRPLRPELEIDTTADLAEMDFGNWEGQPWNTIGATAMAAWTDDFAHHHPGGGESVTQLMQRVARAWQATLASGRPQHLWITHAGVIKATQLLAAGQVTVTRASQWPTGSLAFGGWTLIDTAETAPPAPAGFSS